MIAADAAQLVTEAMGHHVGLRDAQHRRTAGRAVGMATSLGMGVLGGPAGHCDGRRLVVGRRSGG